MTRPVLSVLLALAAAGCRQAPVPKAKITQFKAVPSFIPTGISGKLCYGVENAARLELEPHVEDILPASEKCIDITPKQNVSYTLTAHGEDGSEDRKTVDVRVGAAPPRLSDLSARPTTVKPGARVKVCFKVENAKSVTARPGKLDRRTNCVTDYPRKTTTYKIAALGSDREEDSGTVTVKVER